MLNTDYYRAWAEKNNLDSDGRSIKDILLAKGLAKEEGGVVKPVRAAVLLFAEYPTNLMDTKCAIKIAVYRDNEETFGNVPNMVGTPKIIQGPMIHIIEDAQEYVLRLLSDGIEITSGFSTKFKLPERAVKEGIVNAVIHRDYYSKQDIEIKVFPNRLEIIIPRFISI